MSECKFRAADDECLRERVFPYKEYCVDGPCTHYTSITNADRIRAMTDEELAEQMCDHTCMLCPIEGCEGRIEEGRKKCKQYWLDWLKREIDND